MCVCCKKEKCRRQRNVKWRGIKGVISSSRSLARCPTLRRLGGATLSLSLSRERVPTRPGVTACPTRQKESDVDPALLRAEGGAPRRVAGSGEQGRETALDPIRTARCARFACTGPPLSLSSPPPLPSLTQPSPPTPHTPGRPTVTPSAPAWAETARPPAPSTPQPATGTGAARSPAAWGPTCSSLRRAGVVMVATVATRSPRPPPGAPTR